eukprot:scaffold23007_cov97-Skeletonema_menzelii.AAC.1
MMWRYEKQVGMVPTEVRLNGHHVMSDCDSLLTVLNKQYIFKHGFKNVPSNDDLHAPATGHRHRYEY